MESYFFKESIENDRIKVTTLVKSEHWSWLTLMHVPKLKQYTTFLDKKGFELFDVEHLWFDDKEDKVIHYDEKLYFTLTLQYIKYLAKKKNAEFAKLQTENSVLV